MNFKNLDAFMEQMPERGIPSCELAITRNGETVYRKCVGFSDIEQTVPTSENDVYWIFSATKVITCIAAMQLIERGVIALDDAVSKYFPEFDKLSILQKDGSVVPAENTMTVEHLFTMTGGLSDNLKDPYIQEAIVNSPSTLDVVRSMARSPLLFEPGTRYRYSLCHDILAGVIEVASGVKFSEYLKKNIFEPLGIVDMGFFPNEEQTERFSAMYNYKNGIARAFPREVISNAYMLSPEYESGGAGLFATVNEYIKIITAIACGGVCPNGHRLLSEESIKLMQENHLCEKALNDFVSSRLYGYGWGLCGRVHMNPVTSLSLAPVGEFGWDGAAGAFVMIDRKNQIALYFGTHVFNCNYVYNVIHPTIRNLVYEALGANE